MQPGLAVEQGPHAGGCANPVGQAEFGTKTEMKNMNSFRFIERGIEAEVARQKELIASGGQVVQETLHFDPATGELQPREVEDNYVIMRHFNGRYYVYSRMVHVMQGSVPQWIKDALSRGEKPHLSCGDLIGYVGSAGQSVAPHVHFEVRFYGTWDTEGQYYRGSSRPPRYDPYCGPFLSESGRTTTYWTELPPPGPGEDGPYGLPGTTCQDPYDPALFQGLPARCLTEDDVRWPAGGR